MCLFHAVTVLSLAALAGNAATISGTVTDGSGNAIRDARIDHTGGMVVVSPTHLTVEPSPEEARSSTEGYFRVTVSSPAVVIRKPGYKSQRIRVAGNAHLKVVLEPIKLHSGCKMAQLPRVKIKEANDIDYTAEWIYIDTKAGRKGIIRGQGPSYSWGAPSDTHVWTSLEYVEVMHISGMIDARGRTPDGKYWRSQTSFGEAAQYFDVDRETAEMLDCVMDEFSKKIMKAP
jgi:hypothetical protein